MKKDNKIFAVLADCTNKIKRLPWILCEDLRHQLTVTDASVGETTHRREQKNGVCLLLFLLGYEKRDWNYLLSWNQAKMWRGMTNYGLLFIEFIHSFIDSSSYRMIEKGVKQDQNGRINKHSIECVEHSMNQKKNVNQLIAFSIDRSKSTAIAIGVNKTSVECNQWILNGNELISAFARVSNDNDQWFQDRREKKRRLQMTTTVEVLARDEQV